MPYLLEDPPPSLAGDAVRLTLEGAATIDSAAELKKALLNGLDRSAELVVDCSGASVLDLSALQLLCSAHRTAVALNKKVTLAGVRAEVVNRAIEEAGFARNQACLLSPDKGDCLWIGKIAP